jgi:ElaB/YqjD/DUF883 family membrane-anchored ribosome-binding protein
MGELRHNQYYRLAVMDLSRFANRYDAGFRTFVCRQQAVSKLIQPLRLTEVYVDNESISPAVLSLLNEQAEQSAKRTTRLEKGLEDTFPASDPVSITHTVTATGSKAVEAEPHERDLLGLHPSNEFSASKDDHAAELHAIRRDLEKLRDRLRATTSGSAGTARATAGVVERRVEQIISEQPLATIGFVTALSFILGAGYGARRSDYR